MIICAAIKDTRTGAVFGGIRHGDIYPAMHDEVLLLLAQPLLRASLMKKITSTIVMKHMILL